MVIGETSETANTDQGGLCFASKAGTHLVMFRIGSSKLRIGKTSLARLSWLWKGLRQPTKGSAKEGQLNVVPYRFKKYSTEINRNRKPRILKNLLKSQSFQVDFASLQPLGLDTNFDSISCTFMSKASLGADRHHQRPLQHKVDSKLWLNSYNPRRTEHSCEIARPRHLIIQFKSKFESSGCKGPKSTWKLCDF